MGQGIIGLARFHIMNLSTETGIRLVGDETGGRASIDKKMEPTIYKRIMFSTMYRRKGKRMSSIIRKVKRMSSTRDEK